MSLADAWESNAGDWVAWARAPGHDGFWEGTWPAPTEILPEPAGLGMTFVSVHRPLGAYVAALAGNGMAVTDLREHGDRDIPWILTIRAEKRGRVRR